MKSSRRPFDRSREPDLKKARLARESENVRSFPQKPAAPGSNIVPSRFRAIDRDSESSDPGRGGYHPQPPQHQELLSRYKTALAELTFNSKPIITNLTIIAGENLHAAKAIAATVCGNILEVPSDQKLPSLYLLDSIVKNIGRDYIKYFGMRLPEVFCKTYREVDPPVHQSMRHLFGTWKGVFPPQSLQTIEKDLGFIPTVNGSSSGAINSRPDSQSQRPPHSIHVNPKYLERQRLQQSNRVKGMTSDVIGTTADTIENEERPERTTSISVGRPWDASVEMPDIQLSDRDAISGDYEYGSEPKRSPGFGRRITEKEHDKYGYGVSSNVPETFPQRNGFATKDFLPTKSVNTSALTPSVQILGGRNSSGLSSSWKNSEEEEFVWDDMNSRLTDHGGSSVTGDPRKDPWTPDDSDKVRFSNHLRDQPHGKQDVCARSDRETSSDLFPSDQRELGVHAQRRSSPWHSRDPRLLAEPIGAGTPRTSSDNSEGYVPNLSGISGATSAMARLGGRSEKGSMGPLTKQSLQSLSAASPSVSSSLSRNPPSPSLSASSLSSHQLQSLIEKNLPQVRSQIHPDQKLSVSSVNMKVGQHKQYSPEINPATLEKASLSSQPRRDSVRSEPSGKGWPLLPPPSSVQSSTANLPVSGMKKSNNVVTSKPRIDGTTSSNSSSVEISSVLANLPQTRLPHRSLPSTSLPSSSLVNSVSAETSEDLSKKSQDPISNLLSSLVAKGLISASKVESSSIVESQVPSLHENQNPEDTVPISTSFSSAPNSSHIALSSTKVEIPSSQTADESSDVLPQTTTSAINYFIGFEFKPDIIRELHPSVIESLLDETPYQCSICGLHLKLQEQLDRHLHWHALKNPEAYNLNKASRRWYTRSSDWVARKAGSLSSEAEYADSEQARPSNAIVMEDNEPMVSADENQFACVLCGELFEDVYSLERDAWMFKGAIYMSSFLGSAQSRGESSKKGPIVHANCITEDPALDDILTTVIKTEKDI